MRDYTEIAREEVIDTIARGEEVHAIVLLTEVKDPMIKGSDRIKNGDHILSENCQMKIINQFISEPNSAFYVRKEQ